MRIRVWQAFASNNSGSYTIVGRFREAARAAEVARLLAPLMEAQTRWLEDPKPVRPSPLERLAIDEQLEWDDDDDWWPAYGGKQWPEVLAAGHQVIVHHSYTEGLPRLFGALFYARGGLVDVTIDHAHHPLVVTINAWWPYGFHASWRSERDAAATGVERDLGPVLATHAMPDLSPIVRRGDGGHDPVLQLVVIFDELIAGVEAVREVIERSGGHAFVQVAEASGSHGDPLAPFRSP